MIRLGLMNDEELIESRKRRDVRKFLVLAIDPAKAPRLSVGARAIRNLLLDGQWHPWEAAIAAGLRDNDLAVGTVNNILYSALSVEMIERRGRAGWRRNPDTREVRLIDWPDK